MEPVERRTMFVGNLSQDVNEALLYELCLQAGPVESVVIARPKKTRDEGKKKPDETASAVAKDDGTKSVMYNANGFTPTAAVRQEDEVAYVEVRGCYYFIQNNVSSFPEKRIKKLVAKSDVQVKEENLEVEKSEEDSKQLEKGTDKEDEQNGAEESKDDQDCEEKETQVLDTDVSGPCEERESEKTSPPEEEPIVETENDPGNSNKNKEVTPTQDKDLVAQEKDSNPNRHLGYGFVLFDHECSVGYAIQIFRGTELFGRRLTLQFKTKPGTKSNQQPGNNFNAQWKLPDNNYSVQWKQPDNNFSRWNKNQARIKPIYNFHEARLNTYQGNRYPGYRGNSRTYNTWNARQEYPEYANGVNFRQAGGNAERHSRQDESMSRSGEPRGRETREQNRNRNSYRDDYANMQRVDNGIPEYENYYSTSRFTDLGATSWSGRYETQAEYQKQEKGYDVGANDMTLEEKRALVDDSRREEAEIVKNMGYLTMDETRLMKDGGRREPPRSEVTSRENFDGRRESRRFYESGPRRNARPTYEDFVPNYGKGETDANTRKKPSECLVKLSESFDVALDKFRNSKKVGEGQEQEQTKPRRRKNRKK